jgi:nucleoside phosphorylase
MSDSLVDAAMAHPARTHKDYQIGIICALATEKAAMVAMLDETYPKLKKEDGNENEYTLGRIWVRNVVIACPPAGLMGNGLAAIVVINMRRSFPIKFGLMVGVGGGVWSKKNDIRLGDIVVSQPTGAHGGVQHPARVRVKKIKRLIMDNSEMERPLKDKVDARIINDRQATSKWTTTHPEQIIIKWNRWVWI